VKCCGGGEDWMGKEKVRKAGGEGPGGIWRWNGKWMLE
jgi:hypothetical protein